MRLESAAKAAPGPPGRVLIPLIAMARNFARQFVAIKTTGVVGQATRACEEVLIWQGGSWHSVCWLP